LSRPKFAKGEVTAQSGGYRAARAASDHHVAQSTFLNVSEPSAE